MSPPSEQAKAIIRSTIHVHMLLQSSLACSLLPRMIQDKMQFFWVTSATHMPAQEKIHLIHFFVLLRESKYNNVCPVCINVINVLWRWIEKATTSTTYVHLSSSPIAKPSVKLFILFFFIIFLSRRWRLEKRCKWWWRWLACILTRLSVRVALNILSRFLVISPLYIHIF